MGIRDWFKKKEIEQEEKPQPKVELPELNKEELFEETLSALAEDDVELKEPKSVEVTPEYDSGYVEIDDLMDDEMESNYHLNTVEESDFEDLLAGAEIIGDLPEEVSFESNKN